VTEALHDGGRVTVSVDGGQLRVSASVEAPMAA